MYTPGLGLNHVIHVFISSHSYNSLLMRVPTKVDQRDKPLYVFSYTAYTSYIHDTVQLYNACCKEMTVLYA